MIVCPSDWQVWQQLTIHIQSVEIRRYNRASLSIHLKIAASDFLRRSTTVSYTNLGEESYVHLGMTRSPCAKSPLNVLCAYLFFPRIGVSTTNPSQPTSRAWSSFIQTVSGIAARDTDPLCPVSLTSTCEKGATIRVDPLPRF